MFHQKFCLIYHLPSLSKMMKIESCTIFVSISVLRKVLLVTAQTRRCSFHDFLDIKYYYSKLLYLTTIQKFPSNLKSTTHKLQCHTAVLNNEGTNLYSTMRRASEFLGRDLRIKDNASDVLLRHSWQLMWEDVLKSDKPQQDLITGISI